MSYTKGPWSWWTSNSFRRLSSDATRKDGDVLYACVHSDGVADIVARNPHDARLIAAAPELLEALRKAVVVLAGVCKHAPQIGADDAYEAVSAAIEKATKP